MVTKEKNNLAKTFPIFFINILHDILHEFIKKIYIYMCIIYTKKVLEIINY